LSGSGLFALAEAPQAAQHLCSC